MQRLPGTNIERAQIGGKIVIDEHPGAADLGAGNPASFGALAEFLRMEFEKGGGVFEAKSDHYSNGRGWAAAVMRHH